ncbi:MAG TPA: hypothetical protein VJW51_05550 [Candidatus Acidoferrales bacterium]|nr:hypothetical protein [Candidatus Acidoferrales bacterium]
MAVQSPQPLVRVSLRGAAVRMRSKEPEMKTPQAGALSVAIFALAAVAPAGESWRVKPSTEWNEKDVREILEKSPWAHREKLIVAREQAEVPPVESPDSHSTGSNVPIEPTTPGTRRRPTPSPSDLPALNSARTAEVTHASQTGVGGIAVVRWASARTVREAMARNMVMHGTLTEEQARGLSGFETGDYYIVYVDLRVRLADVNRVPGGGVLTLAMVQNSILRVNGSGERLSPLTVKAAPLPEFDDRKELALAAYYVFFPREKQGKHVLRGDETVVRFECPLAPVPIHAEFDLRKMAREGSPDL